MILTLEALPAAEGDCLLLHWGTDASDAKIALIDGGPGMVYENVLRDRLLAISAKLDRKPLELALAMVSHVDTDHITGIRALFSEMLKDHAAKTPKAQRSFRVLRLWHNTFNDIVGDALDDYYRTLAQAYPAAVAGEPDPAVRSKLEGKLLAKKEVKDQDDAAYQARLISEVLAGQADGRDLRTDYEVLHDEAKWVKFSLNAPFKVDDKPALLAMDGKALKSNIGGLSFTIVGPQMPEIEALQAKFDEYIDKNHLNVEAVLAAYADRSIPNLSSIVCLVAAKVGSAKRTILLTGDARGDKIIEGLKSAGLLKAGKPLHVDILKVPHHGSDRNVKPEFFDQITADHYVFSADGKHGNPDRATLEWLTQARKGDKYHIYLTYLPEDIDVESKKDAKKRGKPWQKSQHSLVDFFAKATGHKFKLHAGGTKMVHLGDAKPSW